MRLLLSTHLTVDTSVQGDFFQFPIIKVQGQNREYFVLISTVQSATAVARNLSSQTHPDTQKLKAQFLTLSDRTESTCYFIYSESLSGWSRRCHRRGTIYRGAFSTVASAATKMTLTQGSIYFMYIT